MKGRGNFVRSSSSLKEIRYRELLGEMEAILMKAEESGISRKALLEELLEKEASGGNDKKGEQL